MKLIAPLLALALAGCAGEAPPPTVIVKYIGAHVEPECLSDDPVWIDPNPARDETRSQTVWREHNNKENFKAVTNNRATCRAGLLASQAKPKRKRSNG